MPIADDVRKYDAAMKKKEAERAHIEVVEREALRACGCKGCKEELQAREEMDTAREWKAFKAKDNQGARGMDGT